MLEPISPLLTPSVLIGVGNGEPDLFALLLEQIVELQLNIAVSVFVNVAGLLELAPTLMLFAGIVARVVLLSHPVVYETPQNVDLGD